MLRSIAGPGAQREKIIKESEHKREALSRQQKTGHSSSNTLPTKSSKES